MLKMNKKGMTLNDMYPAVLTIILVGIVLGVGLFVLTETSNAVSNVAFSVTNETVVFANGTVSVTTAADCGADNFVQTGDMTFANSTATLVSSGNYTFDSYGAITSTAASAYAGNINANVSYTYDGASDTSTTGYCGVMETTNTGLGGFAAWIAVIVVVLAAAIVLGIVLTSFGRGGANGV